MPPLLSGVMHFDTNEWADIKNNAWVTVNNDFFVTSEAIRQWFSRVTKSRVKIIAESPHEWQKIVIHGNECIILFLTRYFMSWTHKSAIIERSFRHCCQGRPFLTEHCDVTTIDLWRHANAKYWYCDVIFVYCHCTRKLAQRRSSLVNNSREYRYLATRYSRLSVLEKQPTHSHHMGIYEFGVIHMQISYNYIFIYRIPLYFKFNGCMHW